MVESADTKNLAAPVPLGTAYWVTGLPGAGKTTLAKTLAGRLIAAGRPVIQLDGDRMRVILGTRYGYGQADRRALAQIYAGLCKELTAQGYDVVCATVSMFHEVRRWSRSNIAGYCEIYLQAPIDVLAARHPKGLYARGLGGHICNVPGIDLAFEEPQTPDIVLDACKPPEGVANDLLQFLNLTGEAA